MYSNRRPARYEPKFLGGGKYIILGVAFGWGYSKGLDVFNTLAEKLTEEYSIVIIGTVAKESSVNSRIKVVGRTADKTELAAYYSIADVFVNPTRQDVLGLVNIESLACETPVITFVAGGSPECIDDNCGVAIPVDDINGLIRSIETVCENHPYSDQVCKNRSLNYDKKRQYKEYLKLYGKS